MPEAVATHGWSTHDSSCTCTHCTGFLPGNDLGRQFEPGNTANLRHGLQASPLLRADDRDEVARITAQVYGLLPVKRPEYVLGCEQLAVRLWRQRRAYGYLSEHGLADQKGKPHALLNELSKVENAIARDLEALGLTPRSAARLGVDVLQGERALSILDHFERKHEREDVA